MEAKTNLKESNFLFRIGLEIETCFNGQESLIDLGIKSCKFDKERHANTWPAPVAFLETTKENPPPSGGVRVFGGVGLW